MDTGGLAQMNYSNNASFMPSNFNSPTSGFASRGGRNANMKRLSVAMPPRASSPTPSDSGSTSPLPRATSRSHLLAGLRTAPKSAGLQSSHSFHQLPSSSAAAQTFQPGYSSHNHPQGGLPRSSTYANFNQDQYALQAAQQQQHNFSSSEHVLAPPSLYGQKDEVDPAVLEQLQLTGMFLAQRQQQLQMQLANITAAANQLQGMHLNGAMYQQQHQQQPIEVPGQPGLYLVFDPSSGQYQYATAQQLGQGMQMQQQQRQYQSIQRSHSPLNHSISMHNFAGASSAIDPAIPTFRAEISPPPVEKLSGFNSRSDTPMSQNLALNMANEHVQPLPPPSANAFRRGHQKKMSSASFNCLPMTDGSKSAGSGLTRNSSVSSNQAPGGFGPGGNRVGVHPTRQPRGPPAIEELKALPTANHEGSKNFAARRRRRALNNLVRAGSMRREASTSPAASPTSDGDLSFHSEADEPGLYRKQSPIGSEMSGKQGSSRCSSLDGLRTSSQVPTPGSEKGNAFDMGHFVRQLPAHTKNSHQGERRAMLGSSITTEKRRSFNF